MSRKIANQAIIEKIQKLLALANNANEHEARLAADKASALLTKYNLSMQDVELSEREYSSVHFMGKTLRRTMEQKYIFSIIGTYFFVRVVIGKSATKRSVWSFFGQHHNVKIAQYVYNFLDIAFHNLYDVYRKENNCIGKNARNSFYLGLSHGISMQLKKTKQQVENETGLIVVEDPHLKDYIENEVGKIKNVPQRRIENIDNKSYRKGIEEGQNLRIATSLESSSRSAGTVKLIAP